MTSMKLLHVIGLTTVVAAVGAASVMTACGGDDSSGGPGPGNDAGTTPDGNTGNPDTGNGNPDTGMGNPDSGAMLSCASYCSTIMANCTGANMQYIDNATCLAMCAKFTVGSTTDTGGQDTLGCRTYHAGAAGGTAANATTHCPHAGPTGAGVCSSSTCAAFCELDLAQCMGAMAAYPDQNTCVTDCNAYARVDGGGEIATTGGNTLDCRIYHLEAAYTNPTTHCPHTGTSVDAGPCH
jgi:hypothetical protein